MHALLATVLVFANKHLSGTMALPGWRIFSVIVVIKSCLYNNNNNIHSNKNPLPPQTYQASLLSAQMLQSETLQCYSGSTNSNAPKPAIACSLQAPFRSWTGTRAVKILFKSKAFSAFSALDQFEYYWIESVKSFWQACMKIYVNNNYVWPHGCFYRNLIRHWNILNTPSNLIQEWTAAKMYNPPSLWP